MMIASSSRMGMIAKLTLLVLVFLGFGISLFSGKRVYACDEGFEICDNGAAPVCIPIGLTCDDETANICQNNPDSPRCANLSSYAKCIKKGYSENNCKCKESKGIYLNTEVPFIGPKDNPRCLVMSTAGAAPVNVLRALTKILMTFVMIGGFGMIVWGGVQIAGGDVKGGKDKIIGVAIAFALLGSLGVILRFINPNFFS